MVHTGDGLSLALLLMPPHEESHYFLHIITEQELQHISEFITLDTQTDTININEFLQTSRWQSINVDIII